MSSALVRSLYSLRSNWVVITGAGISTDSGIPDYRSPGRPFYSPITHLAFIRSERVQHKYWMRSFFGFVKIRGTEPNEAHSRMVKEEKNGKIKALITQNVDGLHKKAGSVNLVELHGSIMHVKCLKCEKNFTRAEVQHVMEQENPQFAAYLKHLVQSGNYSSSKDAFTDASVESSSLQHSRPDGDFELETGLNLANFRIPYCLHCHGTLMPDIVFFGGNVPPPVRARANQIVEESDGLIIIGSSLTVWSAFQYVKKQCDKNIELLPSFKKPEVESNTLALVQHWNQLHKPIIIINDGVTRADDLPVIKVNARITPVLKEIFQE